MIDPKLLRTNPDVIRESLAARQADPSVVDELLQADEDRRSSIAAFEALRAEQKGMGKEVARAKGDEKQTLLARTRDLAAQVKEAEAASKQADVDFEELLKTIPNLVIDGVPHGDEEDFEILEIIGTTRDFEADGFEPRDHL